MQTREETHLTKHTAVHQTLGTERKIITGKQENVTKTIDKINSSIQKTEKKKERKEKITHPVDVQGSKECFKEISSVFGLKFSL